MADCPHCGNSLFYLRTDRDNKEITVVMECVNITKGRPKKCDKEFYVYVDLRNLKQ